MYLFAATIVIAAISTLISAHSNSGIPKIVGLHTNRSPTRDLLENLAARFNERSHHGDHTLKHRADKSECGAGIGSCGKGMCCSRAGFCGSAESYCYSPGCNYQYGPGCPENNPPKGTNTSEIPRPKLGSIAYGGTGIFKCKQPNTVALTYDDGPMKTLTNHILDLFQSYDSKATFFITGNNINKGPIDSTDEYIQVIKRMDSEGHQIASHTWTHLDLSAISAVDRRNQIWMNEMALRNIVNKIPTYLRPPYSSCTIDCQKDLADLGYHIIYFDLDGDDYAQNTKETQQNAKEWFMGNFTEAHSAALDNRRLSISHDILEQTANNLTEFMLSYLKKKNLRSVTVGECLGDPKENWYRTVNGTAVEPDNSTKTSSEGNAPSGTTTRGGSQISSATGIPQNDATQKPNSASQILFCCGLSLSIAFTFLLLAL